MPSILAATSRIFDRVSEAVLLSLAVAAPWAFGAVEAWAQLVLATGLVALAVLRLVADIASSVVGGRRPDPAGFALGGLALLALLHATTLPAGLLRVLTPATHELRSELTPAGPVGLVGDRPECVAAPSATIALDPEASAEAAGLLAAAWVLYRSARALGARAALRRFGVATAANAAVMALFAMVQALTWDGRIYGWRESPIRYGWHTGGPFVGHNSLAAYLNLGLGLSLGLMLSGSRKSGGGRVRYGSAWAALAAGLCATGLLASHSRAGFLAAIAGGLVVAVAGGRVGKRTWVGLAVLAVLVPALLLALGSVSPLRRLATIPGSGASGMNGRAKIWVAALDACRAHGFWGAGFGNFALALTRFLGEARDAAYFHAENEYLQTAVEGGVPGLLLLLAAMAAVGRSARRAWADARARGEGAIIGGAVFGLVSIAVQSLGDFAPHIPGVSLSVLVVAGYLACPSRAGRSSDAPGHHVLAGRSARARITLGNAAGLAVALFVLGLAIRHARAEAAIADTVLPLPGSNAMVAPGHRLSRPELEGLREGLERALQHRPDWALGHLRLGLAYLGLYEFAAADWLSDQVEAGEEPGALADALWLHGSVHAASAEELAELGLLEHDPIRLYLRPAARCFLEARRCSPFLAAVHAELGVVDYLLAGESGASAHIGRVLRLAGPDVRLIDRAAIVAVQAGELDLAARCWRRTLELDASDWAEVADMAAMVLTPDRILDQVLQPGGGLEVEFADRLYAAPEDEPHRRTFLLAAIERSAVDPGRTRSERSWAEARARARLGESRLARGLMERAIVAAPDRPEWRQEFSGWLLAWGDAEAARRQALVGTRLNPADAGLRRALSIATEAVARSGASTSPAGREPSAEARGPSNSPPSPNPGDL